MKKINIDEGITKKRESLGDRCTADEKHQRYEDDGGNTGCNKYFQFYLCSFSSSRQLKISEFEQGT